MACVLAGASFWLRTEEKQDALSLYTCMSLVVLMQMLDITKRTYGHAFCALSYC